MTRKFVIAAAIGFVAICGGATSASAISCQSVEQSVERIGNQLWPAATSQLNVALPIEERISARKKLVIERVTHARFSGCAIEVRVDVTLRRKIRRNAHGHVWLSATVTSFDLHQPRVCFESFTVEDVRLSNTLGVGEAFYRRAANRAMPNGMCVSVPNLR